MGEVLTTQTIIILLVMVATLVAIVGLRVRLPYTVSLVLVGLLISIFRPVDIEITPELIMSIFVPPLLFEAAFHLDFKALRKNLIPISMLAVPGVILTTLLVGGMVTLGTGLPLGAMLVFGALIAATDPVAVVALFRFVWAWNDYLGPLIYLNQDHLFPLALGIQRLQRIATGMGTSGNAYPHLMAVSTLWDAITTYPLIEFALTDFISVFAFPAAIGLSLGLTAGSNIAGKESCNRTKGKRGSARSALFIFLGLSLLSLPSRRFSVKLIKQLRLCERAL